MVYIWHLSEWLRRACYENQRVQIHNSFYSDTALWCLQPML
jgi:hypothetical protein